MSGFDGQRMFIRLFVCFAFHDFFLLTEWVYDHEDGFTGGVHYFQRRDHIPPLLFGEPHLGIELQPIADDCDSLLLIEL